MDGAGRSARSRRSKEPKTDLKAAAIGAAVLLREYFGFDRKRVKARADREPPSRAILWLASPDSEGDAEQKVGLPFGNDPERLPSPFRVPNLGRERNPPQTVPQPEPE